LNIGIPSEFDQAFPAIAQSGAKAVIVLPDPMLLANRSNWWS
jgi:hypothetical protein